MVGAQATRLGVDHVRLYYHYLDTGDTDGYASLLDADARAERPGMRVGVGLADVIQLHDETPPPVGGHHIDAIVSEAGRVVAVGRHALRDGSEIGFADLFLLTELGLLRGYRRYYHTAPLPQPAG